QLLEQEVTAVFAANDLSALGVINAFTQQGRCVPEDVSVVGFDDVRLAAFTSPPLTTIHQPAREIGELATRLLLDLSNDRAAADLVLVLEPRLVVRGSTAPPAHHA